MGKVTHFFLGANSPNGFYSLYDQLIDYKSARSVFILKGGPGCGKSSFMRRIAAALREDGQNVSYIHCSSDPDSLDGVIFPDIGTAFVDGTNPHVVEPKCPGAVDSYVNLGAFYDGEALHPLRDEILSAGAGCREGYDAAYRCLCAARSLMDDLFASVVGAVDDKKLLRRCAGICSRELPKTGRPAGRLQRRFLSGITPKGYICLEETIPELCERVYELCSNYGLARLMSSAIQNRALELGYDVISCANPLNPDGAPQQILIPELSLCFFESSELLPYTGKAYRRVLLDNMVDKGKCSAPRSRLKFSRRMCESLVDRAVASLALSKQRHDALEDIYNPHVDFEGVYSLADEFIGKLRADFS